MNRVSTNFMLDCYRLLLYFIRPQVKKEMSRQDKISYFELRSSLNRMLAHRNRETDSIIFIVNYYYSFSVFNLQLSANEKVTLNCIQEYG